MIILEDVKKTQKGIYISFYKGWERHYRKVIKSYASIKTYYVKVSMNNKIYLEGKIVILKFIRNGKFCIY